MAGPPPLFSDLGLQSQAGCRVRVGEQFGVSRREGTVPGGMSSGPPRPAQALIRGSELLIPRSTLLPVSPGWGAAGEPQDGHTPGPTATAGGGLAGRRGGLEPGDAGCRRGGPAGGPEPGGEGRVQGGVRGPAAAAAAPAGGPGAVAVRAEDAQPAREEVGQRPAGPCVGPASVEVRGTGRVLGYVEGGGFRPCTPCLEPPQMTPQAAVTVTPPQCALTPTSRALPRALGRVMGGRCSSVVPGSQASARAWGRQGGAGVPEPRPCVLPEKVGDLPGRGL